MLVEGRNELVFVEMHKFSNSSVYFRRQSFTFYDGTIAIRSAKAREFNFDNECMSTKGFNCH